jgi:hypothetical protein
VATNGSDTRPAVGPRAALALLRRRSFGPYFAGNALSASGTWFQNLAAALLIYRQTHSALLLGGLNFMQFVPILVLAPWAGRPPTAGTGATCCWSRSRSRSRSRPGWGCSPTSTSRLRRWSSPTLRRWGW